MPAPKYTPAQRAQAIELYRTQGPTAAGKQLGIPKETIMSWAKRDGVHTVRNSRTREATEAKVADAQAKIAAFRLEVLDIARHEAAEIRAAQTGAKPWRTVLKAAGGAERTVELDFIPPQDKRANANSLASHAGTIRNTAPAERENTTVAKSMLDRVIEAHAIPVEVPDA